MADAPLINLLNRLSDKLGGRLAIVSGRSIEQIDAILGEVAIGLAVSGSHGCEHRWSGGYARPERPQSLDLAATELRAFAEGIPGVLVEEKSFGVAVHYRMAPDAEVPAQRLAGELAARLGLELQHGKMMAELRVSGGDKGKAVKSLMRRPPMTGTRPVFIGDDTTDEPAFAAARELGGEGILVGAPRESEASFGIASPSALRGWLQGAAQ